MNLVFPALLVLSLLIPGLIFRATYNSGIGWAYPLGRLGPVSEQIPKAIIHTCWLLLAWICLVDSGHRISPYLVWKIDYASVVQILSNNFGSDQNSFRSAVASVSKSPRRLLLGLLLLYVFSGSMGLMAHCLVRWFRWDRRFRFLRFENDWHYLFSGEILDFPSDYDKQTDQEPVSDASRPVATRIAAVVDLKESSFLYRGFLHSVYFDATGNLDRLLLTEVNRRTIDKSEKNKSLGQNTSDDTKDRYYDIVGDYLSLKISEIKTLNVDYMVKADVIEMKARAVAAAAAARAECDSDAAKELASAEVGKVSDSACDPTPIVDPDISAPANADAVE